MAIDTSRATECYRENRETLLDTVILGASSVPLFNLQTGIKSHDYIHIAQTTVDLGDCECTCTADNTEHTFIDREIKVGCIKVEDTVCAFDFNNMYLEAEIRIEAGRETLGEAGEVIANGFAAAIAMRNEVLIWQGDTASPNANLNKTDGIIKIMTADTEVAKIDLTTQTDPWEILRLAIRALPASAFERGATTAAGPLPFIAVSANFFRRLTLEISEGAINTCCPSIRVERFRGLESFMYLTTGVRVISVVGLNGSGRIIGGSLYDLYLGTDMANGWEEIHGWWSEDCDSWRQRAKYRLGTQIAFPEDMFIATYTDTPTTPFRLSAPAPVPATTSAPVLTTEQTINNAKAAYLAAYDAKASEAEDATSTVKSANTRALNASIKALESLNINPADVLQERANNIS